MLSPLLQRFEDEGTDVEQMMKMKGEEIAAPLALHLFKHGECAFLCPSSARSS